jgi:glucokinase
VTTSAIHERLVLGVDIGGTKILAGVIDRQGKSLLTVRGVTPANAGPEAILDAVGMLAVQLRSETSGLVSACGVGSAGTIGPTGIVLRATDHVLDWAGTDVVAGLRSRLKLPTVAVNDVHAASFGELWAGDCKGTARMLFVAVGTGVGGAVIAGGRVLRGATGAAGSIGHMPSRIARGRMCSCGELDHVEAFASGPGMERTYREATEDDEGIGLTEIAALARGGDPTANSVIVDAAQILGDAIVTAVCLTDPGLVVVGGGVLGMAELFMTPLKNQIEKELPITLRATTVRAAFLGNEAAMVGAGLLAHRTLDGLGLDSVFT